MGGGQPARRVQAGARSLADTATGVVRVVRVVTDVAGIDKEFDYLVPDHLAGQVRVGTIVRVPLGGRRVGGWVVADHVDADPTRPLRPLSKVTGWGPPPDVVELSAWGAWRWAGRRAALLRAASPPTAVPRLPSRRRTASPPSPEPAGGLVAEALGRPRSLVRLPPADDPFPYVSAAAGAGPTLVVAPSVDDATLIGLRLRRTGQAVAVVPRDWAIAAAGGCTVVGARSAAWAPVPGLAAVIVIDAHDEVHQEERAPAWNAWQVAAERARATGAPCVLLSPCPTVELQHWSAPLLMSRADEREGWPVVDVADRREDDPRSGLYGPRLVEVVRSGGRVVCILNRKGRARLLVCAACGDVARCELCGAAVEQDEDGLRCRRCGTTRPVVCGTCGGQRLKGLRTGVTRAREELEALAGAPVGELTGDAVDVPDTDVVVGTEAALHRVPNADVVAFLDFDQELLAPRFRAAEQALGLLARAARLVGGRAAGGRLLVQTRIPGHEVVQAALHADPSRVSEAEDGRRRQLDLPPYAALALVSGEAAPAFVRRLAPGPVVLGEDGGRWLLKAADHEVLCRALAATPRPTGRLRVEVDPQRV